MLLIHLRLYPMNIGRDTNTDLSESEQRFSCAHELGHALLHPDANTPFLTKYTYLSVDKYEIEANKFALKLLIPDELLFEY